MELSQFEAFARVTLEFGLGVNPQNPGDRLFIVGELEHGPLASVFSDVARQLGVCGVHVDLEDPLAAAAAIRADDGAAMLEIVSHRLAVRRRIVETPGALLLGLRSSSYPTLLVELMKSHPAGFKHLSALDAEVRAWHLKHLIVPNRVPWCLVGPPTIRWSKQVFPELPESDALDAAWRHISRFTFCDQPDPLAANLAWDAVTQERKRRLNAMQLRALRYVDHTDPQGTDITFGLHPLHRWAGGSRNTALGRHNEPNFPSKEVYTTPDRRQTNGRFVAGMPFLLHNGALIRGLVMEVKDGEVLSVQAEAGQQEFIDWMDQDKGKTPGMGGRFFGEAALVGDDSSIGEAGIFWWHTLYDENARCHAAVGNGYRDPIEGGTEMSEIEAAEAGINSSAIHTDIMLSGKITVYGITESGDQITLLHEGAWVGDLRIPMAS